MKGRIYFSIAFLLLAIFYSDSITGTAATASKAATYLKSAEANSKKLAVQITYKGNPSLKEPSNKTFITTKNYLAKTKAAVSKLSKTAQGKYKSRIKKVETVISQTTAFQGAARSSKDLVADTKVFKSEYKLNPLSNKTKKAYDVLTDQIRQSDLAYRKVYNNQARREFYTKYIRPAEAAVASYKKILTQKEIDAINKEMSAIETAVRNKAPQAEIDRLALKVDAKLKVLQHPAIVADIKKRLLTIRDGYQILAKTTYESSYFPKIVVDEMNGYVYLISRNDNKLSIYSAKDLSLVKEIFVNEPRDMELYEGKLYVAGSPSLIVNPKALDDEPENLPISNAMDLLIHKNHIYYTYDKTWSEIHDYNMATNETTLIQKSGSAPLDYEFASPVIAIDRAKDILYIGEHGLTAIDLKTKNILFRNNSVEFGGGPLFFENGSVFFSSMRFNPELTEIEGTYPAGYPRDVLAVNGNYVFSGKAVFNNNTYAKVRDLPVEADCLAIDSDMNIYGYRWITKTLTKTKIDLLPMDAESYVQQDKNQLTFKKYLADWVYDSSNDKIYGVTNWENKLYYINAHTFEVEKEIMIGSKPRDIEMYGEKIYVGLEGANKIAVASKNPNQPVTYIDTLTASGLIEVTSDNIFYSPAKRYGQSTPIYVYEKASGRTDFLAKMVKNPKQFTNINESMRGDFKLNPTASMLIIGTPWTMSTVHTGTLEITNQSTSKYDNRGNNGDPWIFFDEQGFYSSTLYTRLDNWNAVPIGLNSSVIYVDRNYILTSNSVYSKKTGKVVSNLRQYWHSAYVNDKNEVFMLDYDHEILRKFKSINEIPQK